MPNLYGISDVSFAERDPQLIQNAIISGYEKAYKAATGEKVTLYPGDPRRLFLLTVADMLVIQRNLIDYTGKQNLLAYAVGDELEHLGLLVGVTRLPADDSQTTMQFTLSAPQPVVTVIPEGTRVTPGGGNIYFAIASPLEIPAGELTGEIPAVALEPGASANGYLPGQINRLVDPLPYVQGVANITTSELGADVEDGEHLRDRIHLAPEGYSNAGSRGAYEFWAKSASSLIVDVGVHSPSPGIVNLYLLLADGGIPGEEILNRVLEVCNDETVRPLTDRVEAYAPDIVSYTLDAVWYLDRADASMATGINVAVEKAVAEWVLWERSKLGRDINPSELTKRMVEAGAKRVEIRSPGFQVLDFNMVAVADSVDVVFGGMEDG